LNAAAEDHSLILANQGVDLISRPHPEARLRLARMLAQQKKKEEARQREVAPFDAWKNALAEF
jgi:hypothetical protein